MVGPGAAGRGPAQEAVAAALERAAAVAHLNAFITLDAEGAGAEAARHDRRGDGARRWCLAVKDNIHVASLPNTAGTPGLAGFVPATDAPVVAALRAAGAIVLGKTNMHELALGVTSGNPTFGAVGNGADPALFAGGSSGGTAAAVASGVVDAGLGTDTGGSVGIPAALNGIYGLRPSAGRYPSAGVTPLSVTRDTPGPMARTLNRLAALDAFVTGRTGTAPPPDRALRLGLPRHVFTEDLEAPVLAAWEAAVDRIARARTILVPVDTGHLVEYDARAGMHLVLGEFAVALDRYLAGHRVGRSSAEVVDAAADPGVAELLRTAALPAGPAYAGPAALRGAVAERRAMQAAYAELFAVNGVDAILSPTVPVCARPLHRHEEWFPLNGREVPTFPTLIRNTSPSATAGLPSVTVPLPVDGSPPVGLQLVGPRGGDLELLAVAARVDALLRRGDGGGRGGGVPVSSRR
ncbi:amidase family protein [Kitasatospora purpeofusca]|uniref:amidase family protein n=1 Tax=Kitasatospora purpeofusca TaxID=67352 RepID=UPI00224DB849|nr:amidase family protein [Kitasatospora purpeofusca]MCX4690414.1 amidase family protein [Kitasatospora purpeofusca]